MPDIASPPSVAAASYAVTGGGSTWAGVQPPSGHAISGSVSGPWLIETQRMDISYERVPTDAQRETYDDSKFSLSSVQDASGAISRTGVITKVTCSYSRRKSTNHYSTSAQQPQTFRVYPMTTDYKGTGYGALPTGAWGPAGAVMTDDVWYHRRLWLSGQDTELEESASGAYNFQYVYNTSAGHWNQPGDADDLFANHESWLGSCYGFRGMPELCDNVWQMSLFYPLYGGYSAASQETNGAYYLTATLDQVGRSLRMGYFWQRNGDPYVALNGYDESRHYYG